jgi:hypothetical protein
MNTMGFQERADVFHCAADGHGSGVEERERRRAMNARWALMVSSG